MIKLLGNFGLSERSIRSAVLRMCRAGLLKVRRDGLKSYYSLTKDGFSLLAKGEQRIFDPDLPEELLPQNWPRPQAATLFREYHDLLNKNANEYFDSVIKEYQIEERSRKWKHPKYQNLKIEEGKV